MRIVFCTLAGKCIWKKKFIQGDWEKNLYISQTSHFSEMVGHSENICICKYKYIETRGKNRYSSHVKEKNNYAASKMTCKNKNIILHKQKQYNIAHKQKHNIAKSMWPGSGPICHMARALAALLHFWWNLVHEKWNIYKAYFLVGRFVNNKTNKSPRNIVYTNIMGDVSVDVAFQ